MRDVDRLREKIQISLDDRQVLALAVCALLLLGGVFSVGLLVGKKLSAQAPAQAASDLAALDAAARQEKPAPAAAVPARPAPQPPVAAEPARETEPSAEKREAAQGRAPAHVAQSALVEPQRPAVVVPPPRPPTLVQPAPQRAAQVAPAGPIALTPPPRDLGQFTVQVGASQDRAEAQRMEAKARAAGLKPYVIEADLGSRDTWYRVRVGAFKDKDAAGRFRHDVERELRSDAVVMPAR
jgi:cell division septation protein DedD